MFRKICYQWGNANVLWKDSGWLWSECLLIQEIITGVDATTLIQPWIQKETEKIPPWLLLEEEKIWDPYQKEKRKRFISLLAKVKGYSEFDEKVEVKDNIKITIDDVKLVVKAVAGIDLKIEKEKLNYGILPVYRQK